MKLTDEQKVKERWPRACIRWSYFAGCWVVTHKKRAGQSRISAVCMNEADAWADAAVRAADKEQG